MVCCRKNRGLVQDDSTMINVSSGRQSNCQARLYPILLPLWFRVSCEIVMEFPLPNKQIYMYRLRTK